MDFSRTLGFERVWEFDRAHADVTASDSSLPLWDDLERRWKLTRDALAVYKELHGDLELPTAFVVPSEAPWPAEAWGLKLGSRVSDIRHQEQYVKDAPERRAELDAMGFRWASRGHEGCLFV